MNAPNLKLKHKDYLKYNSFQNNRPEVCLFFMRLEVLADNMSKKC